MFKKKLIIFIIFCVCIIVQYASASGILKNTSENVNVENNPNIIAKLSEDVFSRIANEPLSLGSDCDIQGGYGDTCPIQNACKVLQDPIEMKEHGFLTGNCLGGKTILPGNIGIYSGSSTNVICVYEAKGDILKKVLPIIETSVNGKCSGFNCKGVEPWYDLENNGEVVIGVKLLPRSIDLELYKNYVQDIRLDTLSVNINGYPININTNGITETSSPFSFNFTLDGTGGENGNKGINYINIEVCDNSYDDITASKVPLTEKYKLNCVSDNFVVKLDPSSKGNASTDFTLNQKKVSCSDFGYDIPQNAEWEFPVQLNGGFLQNCNKDGNNCTPKAKNVCNFVCAKGFIRDGLTCVQKKKALNCKNALGNLEKNEEWILPSVVDNTGSFYGYYSLKFHKYIPDIDECAKECAKGFLRGKNNKCIPLKRENVCNRDFLALGNFEKYKIDPLIGEYHFSQDKVIFNQFWEDRPDSNGFYDGIIEENEYFPRREEVCSKEIIPNASIKNGKIACNDGYAPLFGKKETDRNNIVRVNSCWNWKISNPPICLFKQESENNPKLRNIENLQNISKNNIIDIPFQKLNKGLFKYTSKKEKIPVPYKMLPHKYSHGLIPICDVELPLNTYVIINEGRK